MDKATKKLLIFGGIAVGGLALLVWSQSKTPPNVVVASTAEPVKESWMQTGAGWYQAADGHYIPYSGNAQHPSSSGGGGGISATDILSGGADRLPGASLFNPLAW